MWVALEENWLSFNTDHLMAVTVAKIGETFAVRAFLRDGASANNPWWTLKTLPTLAQAERFKDDLVALIAGGHDKVVSASDLNKQGDESKCT